LWGDVITPTSFTTDNEITYSRRVAVQQWIEYLTTWEDLDPARDDNLALAGKTDEEKAAAAKLHWDTSGQYEGRISEHPWEFVYDSGPTVENGRRIGTASGLFTQSHPESFTTDNNKKFNKRVVLDANGASVYAYDIEGDVEKLSGLCDYYPGQFKMPVAAYGQSKSWDGYVGSRVYNSVESVATYQDAPETDSHPATQNPWQLGHNAPSYEHFDFLLTDGYLDQLPADVYELDWLAYAHQTGFGLDRVRVTTHNQHEPIDGTAQTEIGVWVDAAPGGDIHSAYGFASITNIRKVSGVWRGDLKIMSLAYEPGQYIPTGVNTSENLLSWQNAFVMNGDWRDGTPGNQPVSQMISGASNSNSNTMLSTISNVRLDGLNINFMVGAESYDRVQHRVMEHNVWSSDSFELLDCGSCRDEFHLGFPWNGSLSPLETCYYLKKYTPEPLLVLHSNRDSLDSGTAFGTDGYRGDKSHLVTRGYLSKYISWEQGGDGTWYTVFTASHNNQHVEMRCNQSRVYWSTGLTPPATIGSNDNITSGNNTALQISGPLYKTGASGGTGTEWALESIGEWDGTSSTAGNYHGKSKFGPLQRGEKLYMAWTEDGGAGRISIYTTPDCDPGVAYYEEDGRLYTNRYVLVRGDYTWEEARIDAIRRGGKLAEFQSTAAFNQFMDWTTGMNLIWSRPDLKFKPAWIGATDEGSEGAWKWASDGTSVINSNWRAGEPNNGSTGGLTQNYAIAIFGDAPPYGTWNGQWDDATMVHGYSGGKGANYILQLNNCYTTSQFTYISGRYTWEQAKAEAENRGGRLACITNACLQEKLVAEYLSQVGPWGDDYADGSIDQDLTFWLGGKSPSTSDISSFTWINGLDVDNTYNGWDYRSPNGGGAGTNGMYIGRYPGGGWDDVGDSAIATGHGPRGFVLETGWTDPLEAVEKRYEYISADGTSLSWTAANAAAQARGGRLAVVSNSDDLSKLNTYLDTVNYGIGAWIGLRKVSGSWTWVDGSALSTSNWASGQPDNHSSGGYGEEYVHTVRNYPGIPAHKWNDIDNNANYGGHFGSPRFGYIIEWN
jgi:hypothetical protein